ITYGTVIPGIHGCTLTVKLTTVARPLTATRSRSRDRHRAHTGRGGWMYHPHARQRVIKRRPARQPRQKNSVSDSSAGMGSAGVVIPPQPLPNPPPQGPTATFLNGRNGYAAPALPAAASRSRVPAPFQTRPRPETQSRVGA